MVVNDADIPTLSVLAHIVNFPFKKCFIFFTNLTVVTQRCLSRLISSAQWGRVEGWMAGGWLF